MFDGRRQSYFNFKSRPSNTVQTVPVQDSYSSHAQRAFCTDEISSAGYGIQYSSLAANTNWVDSTLSRIAVLPRSDMTTS